MCDNASNNDAMIKSIANILSYFPGPANQAWCTTHIVNLIMKIILHLFDAKKKNNGLKKKTTESTNDKSQATNTTEEPDNKDDSDNINEDITSLAEGLDREEQEMADNEDDEMSKRIVADVEEIEEALKEEISEVAKIVKPIQRVFSRFIEFSDIFNHCSLLMLLIQLWKLAYAVKRLTTILLPWWHGILEELATATTKSHQNTLSKCIMPCDVSTWWNSTYNMLKFAYSYHDVIDKITGDWTMKLRNYELSESEWSIVKELWDLLKVSHCIHTLNYFKFCYCSTDILSRSSSLWRLNFQQTPLVLLLIFRL